MPCSQGFWILASLASLASCAGVSCAAGTTASTTPGGDATAQREVLDDFALLDESGRFHALYEQADARAVVLVSFAVDSSAVARHAAHLEELARAQREAGARFFYVDSSPLDTREAIARSARELGATIPVLCDPAQWVQTALCFERTAEVVLVDTRDWSVAYRGRVRDDERAYLDEALSALLAAQPVSIARSAPDEDAEPVVFEELAAPSFAADVVPILERRCVECHSRGGIAPWEMSSWERVRGWSPMIREAILARRMPPWHADPQVGTFVNDRSLTALEGRKLLAWIEAGAPRGEGADELPALASRPHSEWPLGEPDIVVEARRVEIPATGLVPYVYRTVELDITEDVWVRATDARPSNRSVLHHARIYIRRPTETRAEQPELRGSSALSWYVPGIPAREYPEGTGKRIPAGSKILFELHYTTTGKAESDSTKLALYLLDSPPSVLFQSMVAMPKDLRIPPLEPHHVEIARRHIDHDLLLHSMTPHMHFRGRAMNYRARYPDGTEEILLSVPRYDFNWQTTYSLAVPKLLPAGTSIVCTAVYDNSPRNPFNPDPTREVPWGPHSSDEMLMGIMDVHEVLPATNEPVEANSRKGKKSAAEFE